MKKDELARRPRGFSAVPFLGDLVALSRLLRDGSAGWGLKLVALFALVYVISPIDAFPEAVAPYIAWLDDVGLVLALRLILSKKLDRYRYPLFESPTPRLVDHGLGAELPDGRPVHDGVTQT